MARPVPDRSQERPPASAAHRAGVGAGRLLHVWRVLPYERRLAAGAALGLFVTLFLPWYQETVVAAGTKPESASVTGWQAFSLVEAVLLLIAAGVLALLFRLGEGRPLKLPGGDGWVISTAGFLSCALVVWRIFDKQSVQISGPGTTVSGVEWGIFVALGVAGLLAYAGSRIRAAHIADPPAPGATGAEPGAGRPPGSPERPAVRRPRPPLVRTSGAVAERFGPRVVPEDPPTLRIGNAPGSQDVSRTAEAEEQLTMPLEELPPGR